MGLKLVSSIGGRRVHVNGFPVEYPLCIAARLVSNTLDDGYLIESIGVHLKAISPTEVDKEQPRFRSNRRSRIVEVGFEPERAHVAYLLWVL